MSFSVDVMTKDFPSASDPGSFTLSIFSFTGLSSPCLKTNYVMNIDYTIYELRVLQIVL